MRRVRGTLGRGEHQEVAIPWAPKRKMTGRDEELLPANLVPFNDHCTSTYRSSSLNLPFQQLIARFTYTLSNF